MRRAGSSFFKWTDPDEESEKSDGPRETYSQHQMRSGPCECSSCVLQVLRHRTQLCDILGRGWRWRHLSLVPRVAAKHQGAAEAPVPPGGGDAGIAVERLGHIQNNTYNKTKHTAEREF